jgi:hypothetical protein
VTEVDRRRLPAPVGGIGKEFGLPIHFPLIKVPRVRVASVAGVFAVRPRANEGNGIAPVAVSVSVCQGERIAFVVRSEAAPVVVRLVDQSFPAEAVADVSHSERRESDNAAGRFRAAVVSAGYDSVVCVHAGIIRRRLSLSTSKRKEFSGSVNETARTYATTGAGGRIRRVKVNRPRARDTAPPALPALPANLNG